MGFRTKLDYSNNRQIKQHIETSTHLSGATVFGLPLSQLPSGPDLTTSAITKTTFSATSTFTGNDATTNFNWYVEEMQLGYPQLSAITPSNSGTSQYVYDAYAPETTTTVDGNTIVLTYTGVSYDLTVTEMVDLGGNNYSGSVITMTLEHLSADALEFTGRTIWVDVSGTTRTNDLIITNGAGIGKVWQCVDSEGKGAWMTGSGGGSSGSSETSYWSAGTGTNAIATINSNNSAMGINSLAEGFNTVASQDYAHSEGWNTQALGIASHAEGEGCIAHDRLCHAEGDNTQSWNGGHSEGGYTQASGIYSHAEGQNTRAIGTTSHAGGMSTISNGDYSFVHGSNSVAFATNTIVLGANITGNTNDTTYVDQLNIKTIGSAPSVNDLRIDANGNLTTNTSDERFKENIRPLINSLEVVTRLKGVSYQWRNRDAGGDDIKIGFIAQQVESVEPLLVYTNRVDGYKGIHIDSVIPLLVEAIKELNNVVTKNTYLKTQTILAEDNNIDLNFNGTYATAIGGGISVINAKPNGESVELKTDENGNWITNNSLKPNELIIPYYTPSSSDDTSGSIGSLTRDDDYLYLKKNTGWGRINFENF